MTWLLHARILTCVPCALYSLSSSHMPFFLLLAHAKFIPASGPLHMLLSLPGAFFPRPHIAVSSLVLRSQPTSHLSLECASQPPWPSSFPLPALRLSRLTPLLIEHQHHKDRVLLPLSALTSQSPGQGLAHSPMCTEDPAADVSLGHSWGVDGGKPTRIWVRAPSS